VPACASSSDRRHHAIRERRRYQSDRAVRLRKRVSRDMDRSDEERGRVGERERRQAGERAHGIEGVRCSVTCARFTTVLRRPTAHTRHRERRRRRRMIHGELRSARDRRLRRKKKVTAVTALLTGRRDPYSFPSSSAHLAYSRSTSAWAALSSA